MNYASGKPSNQLRGYCRCERDSTRQPRRQIAATIHTKLMDAVKQVLGVSHTHTGSTRTVTRRSGERAHYKHRHTVSVEEMRF